MDDQRREHIDPKIPPQRDHPKQLQIHNVPNYDVENPNSTNKGRNLLLAKKSHGLFPKEEKGSCKVFSVTRELLYIDRHILKENMTRWKNLAMAWIDNKKTYMDPQSLIRNSYGILTSKRIT